MKRLVLVSAVSLISLSGPNLFAQEVPSTTQSVSLQPIFWLDSMVPRTLLGFSGQYELGIAHDKSLAWRLFWFSSAIWWFSPGSAYDAVGICAEYRVYFSNDIRGWHLGPFVEGIWYRSPGYGYEKEIYDAKNAIAAGLLVGHKWISRHITFDISVQTAWYSQSVHVGTFLPTSNSHLNSHLLISIGYAF